MPRTKKDRAMPIPFAEFESSCREHGYTTRVANCDTYYVMYTRNGIKTEVKPRWYTLGYGRSSEDLDVLESELRDAGFPVKDRKNSVINISYQEGEDVMSRFWEIVAFEEGLDAIVARARGSATRAFPADVADRAIWSKIARAYRFAIDNEHQHMLDDHRHMLCADAVDHLITIGSSRARTADDSYREHVVPCVMIHNRAIEMTQLDASTVEIAAMIAANMMIVQITTAEAKRMDEDLGMRTTMPTGWIWGDDPLARLRHAGIELA